MTSSSTNDNNLFDRHCHYNYREEKSLFAHVTKPGEQMRIRGGEVEEVKPMFKTIKL